MQTTITHGSTFSGIGAPEIAAAMLGWENVFHCEINPFGRSVLDYYFPKAKSYEDITKTDFSEWGGQITVLTGGFPCQPFSYAGKRRGSEDDRYLWPFMLRCIEQVRPTWFVGENVSGITTMEFPAVPVQVGEEADLFGDHQAIYELRQQLVLHEIIQSLERIGYSVQPLVIPACAVGAPHRRDRIFIVAHRLDAADPQSRRSGGIRDEGSAQGSRNGDVLSGELGGLLRERGTSSYTPSQRRREIYEQVQSKLADGEEPLSDGGNRIAADTESGTIQAERDGYAQHNDTAYEQHGGRDWPCGAELLPENRWRAFPTVSPVYRGNDGLPFPVDDLTIPFSEWKKESLKAYGNAIVPQVMYEIFRCIQEIEQIY